MAEHQISVDPEEIDQVLKWGINHNVESTTEHEDGTYEEGVADALLWALGQIRARPDNP